MGHPAVQEAAVIAVPSAKWMERPMAAVVLRKGAAATPQELRQFLEPKMAKWFEKHFKLWQPQFIIFFYHQNPSTQPFLFFYLLPSFSLLHFDIQGGCRMLLSLSTKFRKPASGSSARKICARSLRATQSSKPSVIESNRNLF